MQGGIAIDIREVDRAVKRDYRKPLALFQNLLRV